MPLSAVISSLKYWVQTIGWLRPNLETCSATNLPYSGTSRATSSPLRRNTRRMPSFFSARRAARSSRPSSVAPVQAVPQKTRVALVEAAMGATSLSNLPGCTSWASSTSSSVEAVAPTMLLSGAAERK